MDIYSVGDESNLGKSVHITKQGILYTAAWLVVMIPLLVSIVSLFFVSGGDPLGVLLPNWFYGESHITNS